MRLGRASVLGGVLVAGRVFGDIYLGNIGTSSDSSGYLFPATLDVLPAGDINADGCSDFVAGGGTKTLHAFMGRPGSASFEPSGYVEGFTAYAMAVSSYYSLGPIVGPIGDVDGDGFDDVAAMRLDETPRRIQVIYGEATPPVFTPSHATGTRRPPPPPAPEVFQPVLRDYRFPFLSSNSYGYGARFAPLGFFDRDDHADFLYIDTQFAVHRGGTCSGSEPANTAPQDWCMPGLYSHLVPDDSILAADVTLPLTGDVDGDGIPDIVDFRIDLRDNQYFDTLVRIRRWDVDGLEREPVELAFPSGGGWSGICVPSPAGDFDGDGVRDLFIFGLDASGQNSLWLLRGGPSVVSADIPVLENSPLLLPLAFGLNASQNLRSCVGDFTGDGFDDIVSPLEFTRDDGSREGFLLRGSADPTPFTEADIDSAVRGVWIADDGRQRRLAWSAGDVDGDGMNDLMFSRPAPPGGGLASTHATVLFNPFEPNDSAVYRTRSRSGATPLDCVGGNPGPKGIGPDSRCWVGFDAGTGPGGGSSLVEVELDRTGEAIGRRGPDGRRRFAKVSWHVSTDRVGWSSARVRVRYTQDEVADIEEDNIQVWFLADGAADWERISAFALDARANRVEFAIDGPGRIALAALPEVYLDVVRPADGTSLSHVDPVLPFELSAHSVDDSISIRYRIVDPEGAVSEWVDSPSGVDNGTNWTSSVRLGGLGQYSFEVQALCKSGGESEIATRAVSVVNSRPIVTFRGSARVPRFVLEGPLRGTAIDPDSNVATLDILRMDGTVPGPWENLAFADRESGTWDAGVRPSGTYYVRACDPEGECGYGSFQLGSSVPQSQRARCLTEWGDAWSTASGYFGQPYSVRTGWLGHRHEPDEGWHSLLGVFDPPETSYLCANPWGELWMATENRDTGVPRVEGNGIVAYGWQANWSEGSGLLVADIDRTGVDDLLRIGADGVVLAGMNGVDGLRAPVVVSTTGPRWDPANGYWVAAGDVNADSCEDLVCVDPAGRIDVYLAGAGPSLAGPEHWGTWDIKLDWGTAENPSAAWGLVLGDFTGEGATDIACIPPSGCARVCRSTGSSYLAPEEWGCIGFHAAPHDGWSVFPVQFSWEGWQTGLMQINHGPGQWLAFSNGTAFEAPLQSYQAYDGYGHTPWGPWQTFMPLEH